MKTLVVIPARYASVRFPSKMMAEVGGETIIGRTYRQAKKAKLPDEVVVATDHSIIFDHCTSEGIPVVMTSDTHESGTDRIAEVARERSDVSWVINVQGDEPFLDPMHIDILISTLQNSDDIGIVTTAIPLEKEEDYFNKNIVKVVMDQKENALYFSRSAIPHHRDVLPDILSWRHLGMYGYKREVLMKITSFPPGKLEKVEKLEQLRWLEAGYKIRVKVVKRAAHGIDTPEDLLRLVDEYQSIERDQTPK